MPRKPRLTASKLVKEMARARIGSVPATRKVADARRKPARHKQDLAKHPDAES